MKLPTARPSAYVLVLIATLCIAAGQADRATAEIKGLPAVQAAAGPMTRGDAVFLQLAAQLEREELEAAKLASAQATNAHVRAYAQIMVRDHGPIGSALASLGATPDLAVTPGASEPWQRLNDAEGPSFDRRYTRFVSAGQARAIALYASAATAAVDPEVKRYAARTLPQLQRHLEMAQRLNDVATADP